MLSIHWNSYPIAFGAVDVVSDPYPGGSVGVEDPRYFSGDQMSGSVSTR
jgi:hypothetical protein